MTIIAYVDPPEFAVKNEAWDECYQVHLTRPLTQAEQKFLMADARGADFYQEDDGIQWLELSEDEYHQFEPWLASLS